MGSIFFPYIPAVSGAPKRVRESRALLAKNPQGKRRSVGGISDPSFRSSARAGISSRYPVRVEFPGSGGGGVARAALAFALLALLLQGVLPARSAQGTAGLLGLQPLLRRLRLRHRERQEEGGRGGGAGEPRRKRLQHGAQHLLLQKPPVRQLNP